MAKKDKIIIYSNETCPYCKKVKEKLAKEKIKYTNKFTSKNQEEWGEVVDLLGMAQVPVVCCENNYFIPARDFNNEDHLVQIIKNYKPSKFSTELICLERLKTLNYNINMAFVNLDNILKQIEKNYRELFEEETKKE